MPNCVNYVIFIFCFIVVLNDSGYDEEEVEIETEKVVDQVDADLPCHGTAEMF